MGETLVDCTEGAAADEFGACDLNESYPSWLERYVDTSRETDGTGDDQAAESFEEAKETQQDLVNQTREHNQIYDKYQEAQENNNTTRARRLARELTRIQNRINSSSSRLTELFRDISTTTRININSTTNQIDTIRRDTNVRTESAIESVLTSSSLRITRSTSAIGNDSDISFLDPLIVTARLKSENGTAIGNRDVLIAVGNQRIPARTGSNGTFTLKYRPKTIPTDTEQLTLRYLPPSESAYLPSEDLVSVDISQVGARVTVAAEPDTVSFGERVNVNGSVLADDRRVSGIPVTISLGETAVSNISTGPNGSYLQTVRVPASVTDGPRTVRLESPLQDRALSITGESTSLSVVATDTTLSLETRQTTQRSVRISGELTTVEGNKIPGQTLVVSVDDRTLSQPTTGEMGQYQETVALPEGISSDPTVTLNVRYDGSGTNLESTRRSAELRLTTPSPTVSDENTTSATADAEPEGLVQIVSKILRNRFGITLPLGASISIILLGVLMGGGYYLRRDGSRSGWFVADETANPETKAEAGISQEEASTGATDSNEDGFEADLPEASQQTSPIGLIEIATDRIANGDTDTSAIASYAALRRTLEDELAIEPGQTHWEFVDTCVGNTQTDGKIALLDLSDDIYSGESVELLRDITLVYEVAAFAPEPLSEKHAEKILQIAQSAVRPENSTGTSS
jgi:hypothetical protein